MKTTATCLLFAGLSTLWAADGRAADGDAPAPSARPAPYEVVGRFEIGYRGSFVTDAGYNPFSTRDYLPQLSIGVTRTLAGRGPWSFAAGVAWDNASTGATSLGDTTSLTLNRLTVLLEGRARFGRWGYAFVRGAPGIALENLEVDDPSVPNNALTKSRWLFAADLSGGYAFPLWTRAGTSSHLLSQLWVQADGGYGIVADDRLDLTPSGQGRADGVDLGVLALRGALFRVSLAASL
jgi:hypothetical protein